MPSSGRKGPGDILKDKFRSIFTPKDPQKKKDALPPKAHFSIWYFLMAFLLFFYLQQNFFSAKVETILYSQFKQYIAEGIVGKLIIGPENIKGTLTGSSGKEFTTVRVSETRVTFVSQKESMQGEELRKMLSASKSERVN
jgi:cell division protease FtsH